MLLLLSILSGVLFPVSIYLFVSYIKLKNKYKMDTNKYIDDINLIKQEILSTNRIGYYEGKINLMSKIDKDEGVKTGDQYDYVVHIKELDRYKNGISKIEIINIDLISGFDQSQFDWVKSIVKQKFSTLRKTSDIEWLESEESIKEQRKLKLERLEKLNEVE